MAETPTHNIESFEIKFMLKRKENGCKGTWVTIVSTHALLGVFSRFFCAKHKKNIQGTLLI